jgi:hypothetical protein
MFNKIYSEEEYMIPYAVKQHIPGRIRIEIPPQKKMASTDLKHLADRISTGGRPQSIRDISANPLAGRVTISYDPVSIDVMEYLSVMAETVADHLRKGAAHEVR